uniref:fibulin-2-like n=1 Tax=Myxine glutinosa TaxID=7769 RepID=UPI00358F5AFC
MDGYGRRSTWCPGGRMRNPLVFFLLTLLLGLELTWARTVARPLDCTGVACPLDQGCAEERLEQDSCCPTCVQRGCTCQGYQYYDCLLAGFLNGKVGVGGAEQLFGLTRYLRIRGLVITFELSSLV